MRRAVLLTAAGLLLACGLARAADPSPLAGFWKLNIPSGEDEVIFMLAFTEQDGKWVGDYLTSNAKLRTEPKFKSLKVNGDNVQYVVEIPGGPGREPISISFDGVLAKDKKKVTGSIAIGDGKFLLTDMYPTKLKKLDDPFELARETLLQIESGQSMFEAAIMVASKAGEKKLPADEMRAIIDRVNKAASSYGPRWERDVTIRLADALAGQEGHGDIAVAQAKRAERLLSDDDDAMTRLKVLEAVSKALNKAGKADDAKPYAAQIAKLEARDYAEYAKTQFKVEPFAGRKAKTDRAMLVEVFTGAECPPCVAVDLAFDGLMKAYKPSDVILLQYHVHIPGPDPLTSSDSMKRVEEYYADQVRGAPTVFIGGKLGEAGGGPAAAAEKKYLSFRKQIEEGLEKAPGVKLGLTLGKGEKGGLTAKATVNDLEMPGDKMSLRFALAEERVRYTGGNGIRYHHMVVRSMPGGVKGFPLTKKMSEHSVSFDPEAVRAELTKYLDNFAKEEGPFPRPERPLSLKNLKLIAFVQNDATREVLQAVQVDVP